MKAGIRILTTSETDLPEWRLYYDRLPRRSIYHSPDYIRFLENHYQDDAELFIFGDEDRYVYYPYFKKRLDKLPFAADLPFDASKYCDISSSWYYGGPLVNNAEDDNSLAKDFIAAFSGYARENGFLTEFIRFDPNLENHLFLAEHIPLLENRQTVFVDLSESMTEIYRNFSPSNRRNIKHAEKNGVISLTADAPEDWEAFAQIYQQEMIRKKASRHLHFSLAFFMSMRSSLQDNCRLIKATLHGKCIGGFIIIYDDYFGFHFLSASLREYWNLHVNNNLFLECIKWAKNKALSHFDFMGGREGVFNFKQQFSHLRKIFYTAAIVHKPDFFNKLCRASERNNILYFPPYRASAEGLSE